MVMLRIGKMLRSGAMNSPKGTVVHSEQRSGRPSLISDDLLQKTEGEICANWHHTIKELHHIIPKMSKTTFHEVVTKNFSFLWISAAITTHLTQTKPVLPLPNKHGSQLKDQGQWQCCHTMHKKFPLSLHVMYLYFLDTGILCKLSQVINTVVPLLSGL
jgi:hypothetical protein